MPRPLLALGLGALLVLVPALVGAGVPTDQLKAAVHAMIQILEDPALKPEAKAPERQAAVRAAVEHLFDFSEISKRALGRHWRTLGDAERDEFTRLFRAFLERKYLPRINLYEGERLQFVDELVDGHLASVDTRLKIERYEDVPVTFRLHRPSDRWLIYDILVEGISLVRNYRVQFDRLIQRKSYQELVARIKHRLATPASSDKDVLGGSPRRR